MQRYLIYDGEYQGYKGQDLIGGSGIFSNYMHHSEDDELLMAIL